MNMCVLGQGSIPSRRRIIFFPNYYGSGVKLTSLKWALNDEELAVLADYIMA